MLALRFPIICIVVAACRSHGVQALSCIISLRTVGIAAALLAVASATGALDSRITQPVFTQAVIIGSVVEAFLANALREPANIVSVGARYSASLC